MSDEVDTPEAEVPVVEPADDGLLSIQVEVPTEDGGIETKEIRFKSLQTLPIGLVRETRHDNTVHMWAVVEWALPPEYLAVFDSLPLSNLWDLFGAIQKASSVTSGE